MNATDLFGTFSIFVIKHLPQTLFVFEWIAWLFDLCMPHLEKLNQGDCTVNALIALVVLFGTIYIIGFFVNKMITFTKNIMLYALLFGISILITYVIINKTVI
jgi:hypothetical protein